MKFTRAARIISVTALSGALAFTASPAIAQDNKDHENMSHFSDNLEDNFDDYEEAIAVAGGVEQLSDHEIQEMMIRYL